MTALFDLPVFPLNVVAHDPHFTWLNSLGPNSPPHQVKPTFIALRAWHDGHGANTDPDPSPVRCRHAGHSADEAGPEHSAHMNEPQRVQARDA